MHGDSRIFYRGGLSPQITKLSVYTLHRIELEILVYMQVQVLAYRGPITGWAHAPSAPPPLKPATESQLHEATNYKFMSITLILDPSISDCILLEITVLKLHTSTPSPPPTH